MILTIKYFHKTIQINNQINPTIII